MRHPLKWAGVGLIAVTVFVALNSRPETLEAAEPEVYSIVEGKTTATGDLSIVVVGIVSTKVCDENGPIRRGDLLVTSSLPGHAMRAPRDARLGTVVGKALGNLDSGTGRIEILLSLQ